MKHFLKKIIFASCFATLIASSAVFAKDQTVHLLCALTDIPAEQEKAIHKSQYRPDTKMLYLYCDSEDIPEGVKLTVNWVALSTGKAAPENYLIAEKTIAAPKREGDSGVISFSFTLSRPDKGWPLGDYSADIYLEDDEDPTLQLGFIIKR